MNDVKLCVVSESDSKVVEGYLANLLIKHFIITIRKICYTLNMIKMQVVNLYTTRTLF